MKLLLYIQSFYFLITALWPLLHMRSFLKITGPKTDLWLVRTVAVLLLAISTCFFLSLLSGELSLPVRALAAVSAALLAMIDFYYSLKGTISKVYLIDGVLEILFLVAWIILLA